MKRLILICLGFFLSISLFSHPWKPNHYVIIDTDGGIDDMRAITMLLASPDVRVLALTVSPGALSAGNAYIKVKSLLNSFYHEGIPVGINRKSRFNSPEFAVASGQYGVLRLELMKRPHLTSLNSSRRSLLMKRQK